MKNKVTVRKEQAWGNIRYAPVCEKAQLLAQIAGTKTLTDETIRLAKQLGYSFELEREVI